MTKLRWQGLQHKCDVKNKRVKNERMMSTKKQTIKNIMKRRIKSKSDK